MYKYGNGLDTTELIRSALLKREDPIELWMTTEDYIEFMNTVFDELDKVDEDLELMMKNTIDKKLKSLTLVKK